MKFSLYTQGCKVNQYDGGIISKEMLSAGFSEACEGEAPDIIIINSCTVTENSDKKAARLISRLKRDFPAAIIVLTGCYSEAFPKEAREKTKADIVIGNSGKSDIPQLISDFFSGENLGRRESSVLETVFKEPSEFFHSDKTRAFIKIEDGCNRFCSYCIIPMARGRVRSRALQNIAKETHFHALDGHKEIVLTGINLSCYGSDIGLSLYDAIKIVAKEPKIERVRLSSLEPERLTYETIEKMMKIKKLCPHFHLSLQSGSDSVLKRMNRHYTSREYEQTVNDLRAAFPSCAVTTDIMVGFSGETDEEFQETTEFAQKIGFAKIHVFTYSPRPGTAAARLDSKISESVKAERYEKMFAVSQKSQNKFFEDNMNITHKILVEKQTNPEYICGYTENYIPVRLYNKNAKRHDIVSVRIEKTCEGYCVGTTADNEG